MAVPLDRYLRYDELTGELHRLVGEHPGLASLTSIGRSHEGRDIWLVTITDASTGPAEAKPAHWVDANIHATEVTGSAAALHLVDHLLTADDPAVDRARRTRTFYVVPRVNPDGAEAALADRPRFLRSSTRPWPWRDGRTPPGLEGSDIDGDGRILHMRIVDPDGIWKAHPEVPKLLVPRAPDDGPEGGPYYRLLEEGLIAEYDGYTIPTPRPAAGLDLNRNYPAGWGTGVTGSGDHPLSEPEVDAVVRAMVARPNICGFNAYHTYGGVLLRPSSTRADSALPPMDVWTWKELGARLTETSGYTVHSVYEDFTWDKADTMSGASDDWAYEHLGIYSWTTEFWDVIAHATDHRAPTAIWFLGPSLDDELAVLRWFDERAPGRHYVDWYPFEHPQLGPVELGGWDDIFSWSNPPLDLLAAEVAPHAAFAVQQALAAPELAVRHVDVQPLGGDTWAVAVGVANVGYLPTDITAWARKQHLVLPLVVEIGGDGVAVLDGPARRELGQLEGRVHQRFNGGARNDGTPDRVLERFVVRAAPGTTLRIDARHPRAGRDERTVVLGS